MWQRTAVASMSVLIKLRNEFYLPNSKWGLPDVFPFHQPLSNFLDLVRVGRAFWDLWQIASASEVIQIFLLGYASDFPKGNSCLFFFFKSLSYRKAHKEDLTCTSAEPYCKGDRMLFKSEELGTPHLVLGLGKVCFLFLSFSHFILGNKLCLFHCIVLICLILEVLPSDIFQGPVGTSLRRQ